MKPEIAAEIAAGKEAQLKAAGLNASRILEELGRLALVDSRSFYDDRGNIKPVSELTEAQGAALQSIEVIIKNAKAGDGETDEIHKIRLWDKPKALDILAKHFGLLTEQVHHTGDLVVRWAK